MTQRANLIRAYGKQLVRDDRWPSLATIRWQAPKPHDDGKGAKYTVVVRQNGRILFSNTADDVASYAAAMLSIYRNITFEVVDFEL